MCLLLSLHLLPGWDPNCGVSKKLQHCMVKSVTLPKGRLCAANSHFTGIIVWKWAFEESPDVCTTNYQVVLSGSGDGSILDMKWNYTYQCHFTRGFMEMACRCWKNSWLGLCWGSLMDMPFLPTAFLHWPPFTVILSLFKVSKVCFYNELWFKIQPYFSFSILRQVGLFTVHYFAFFLRY